MALATEFLHTLDVNLAININDDEAKEVYCFLKNENEQTAILFAEYRHFYKITGRKFPA